MKGLNKLALATAVAAAPFATQAMEPMSDQAMGETTGQAGVTIELSTEMSIDQIAYSQGADTGSFLVNNLEVGGIGTDAAQGFGDALDMEINVDLPEQGDTLSTYGSKAGNDDGLGGEDLTLNDGDALISVQSYNEVDGEAQPVDLRMEMGTASDSNPDGEDAAFQLSDSDGSNTATLVSELKADVFLTQLDIIARNDATDTGVGSDANGALEIEAAFAVDDLDAQFDVASVGIENMRMAGAGSLGVLKGASQGSGEVLGGGAAIVSMDIGQGGTLSGTGPSETLRVNLANFQADIWMPTITVGNNGSTSAERSIGSVGISNLQVTNTEMSIYGRE
ncbi:hypothetical protein DES49_1659 [Halospina denitrificans]|uniref:DUF6160 domain-containing protein n=1 Tax=Halospina denitrificans TaxID=332522 RepID=A0A4R7JVU9_9GAMM|nr:DUF6160 family protein [Halospina denitrificans]TDT41563.1 hypothetical protein DES49_1659 [Halospina denitrificans]